MHSPSSPSRTFNTAHSTNEKSFLFMLMLSYDIIYNLIRVSQVALVVKNQPVNAGDVRDVGLISGSARSPGGGHGNPL